MKENAIYPGTFDPITNGHTDIIERASNIFDKVIVAVAENTNKEPTFTIKERIELAKAATVHIENACVEGFKGLSVDYVKEKNSSIMIRGLRAVSDFEFELQLSLANRDLCSKVESIYLIPKKDYIYLSSSLLKQIIKSGGKIDQWAHPNIISALEKKLK